MMKQLVRYILLIVSMVLIGHGDVSAASNFASGALPKKDGLAKVEHHVKQQDAQFVAAQLFSFKDFSYQPVTEMKVYTGKTAEAFAKLF